MQLSLSKEHMCCYRRVDKAAVEETPEYFYSNNEVLDKVRTFGATLTCKKYQ